MSKFLLLMHFTGEYPADEAGQAEMGQAWGGWYGSIGPAIVDAGGQGGQGTTVAASGSTDASGQVTGYTIVEAADHAAAVEIAQRNPIVTGDSGTVDVIDIIEMG